VARPTPLPAPVTMAILFERVVIIATRFKKLQLVLRTRSQKNGVADCMCHR
jgi:hypothetical protein